MKFLADMGISTRTVAHLRKMGHDSVHLRDEHMQRSGDAAVLQKAFRESRVLLTHDLDFGDLMAASKGVLPSAVIFRLRDMRPDVPPMKPIQGLFQVELGQPCDDFFDRAAARGCSRSIWPT